MLITDLDKFKKWPAPAEFPPNHRRFWSPYDDGHGVLMTLLDECHSSMVMSMYGLTDPELAAKVDENLNDDDLYCQVTLDATEAASPTERKLLFEKLHWDLHSNSVAWGRSEKGKIIHLKVLILDGVWLVTGSTNWSVSGETEQDNELLVTYSAAACAEARNFLDLSHAKALTDTVAWRARRKAAA